jgi:hypothetical protein
VTVCVSISIGQWINQKQAAGPSDDISNPWESVEACGCGLVLLRKSTGNHHFYIVLASNTEVSCRFFLEYLELKATLRRS